jgi:hypothetical protein
VVVVWTGQGEVVDVGLAVVGPILYGVMDLAVGPGHGAAGRVASGGGESSPAPGFEFLRGGRDDDGAGQAVAVRADPTLRRCGPWPSARRDGLGRLEHVEGDKVGGASAHGLPVRHPDESPETGHLVLSTLVIKSAAGCPAQGGGSIRGGKSAREESVTKE